MTTIDIRARFDAARSFEQFLEIAEKNRDLWLATSRMARAPDELVARLAATGGAWHFLVLSEDWCGDAVNTVPVIAKLAELAPNADLRILSRDENLDLMDAHLSGTARAIPVVIVYDADFNEAGWWGSRPRELQAWVKSPEGQAMDKDARYKEIRRWYARDKGTSAAREIVELVEKAAVLEQVEP